ncbi:MAG: DUF1697 domain-containing protein, partial [Gemmatimonadaceae bacterium]
FERLGLRNVETFIASGNVIFEAPVGNLPQLEDQIGRHLQNSLGYEVTTFIRTPAETAAIAAFEAFPPAELEAPGSSLYVVFLPAVPRDAVKRRLRSFRSDLDDFVVNGREVYWLCRTNLADSPYSRPLLGKTLGVPATVRNIKTVRKLAAKYAAGATGQGEVRTVGPRSKRRMPG